MTQVAIIKVDQTYNRDHSLGFTLDPRTRVDLAPVTDRTSPCEMVVLGLDPGDTPELPPLKRLPIVELLTGLRDRQLDEYHVVLWDSTTNTEVVGWW